MPETKSSAKQRPLISHSHQKRSLGKWLLPLVVVVLIIVLLPKLVGLLDG